MKNASLVIAVSVMLVASCAEPAQTTSPTPAPYSLAKEVEDFISDRDICDHLRGEIPEPGTNSKDSPSIDDINLSCAGTDKRLEALRAKYANDPRAIAALSDYEWPIEANDD